MQTQIRQSRKPSDEHIASVTYAFWERAGCPQGQEMQFWVEAERYIMAVKKAQSRKPGGRLLDHRIK